MARTTSLTLPGCLPRRRGQAAGPQAGMEQPGVRPPALANAAHDHQVDPATSPVSHNVAMQKGQKRANRRIFAAIEAERGRRGFAPDLQLCLS